MFFGLVSVPNVREAAEALNAPLFAVLDQIYRDGRPPVETKEKTMVDHDEALFQRINLTRAKLVGTLRVALNGAGMKERGASGHLLTASQDRMLPLGTTEGYDIERVIQAAVAIRAALEPFDNSVPRAAEDRP